MKFSTLLFSLCATTTLAAKVTTLHQFPNNTWVENLAQMHNGSLLVTFISAPQIHIVHPDTRTSNLVATFPNATAVLGITELQCDVFAVAVGSLKPTNEPVMGSFAIWSIDLRNATSNDTVTTSKIADLPSVSMVNGLTRRDDRTLLLADSWAGDILALDVKMKTYEIAFAHPSLSANFSSAQVPPLGVNGLRWDEQRSALYYSNNVQSILGVIKPGHACGPRYEVIAMGAQVGGPDDLAVLSDGSVLLARPAVDVVVRVGLNGTLGESVGVNGPTSVVLGREYGDMERKVVYASTSGLVRGMPREGGRVVRIEY